MSPSYMECLALPSKTSQNIRILPIVRACDIPQSKHHRQHRHHDHDSHRHRHRSSSEVLCETTTAQREIVYRNDDGSVRKTVFFDRAGNPSIVIYNPDSPVARGGGSEKSSASSSLGSDVGTASQRSSSASSGTSATDTSTTASTNGRKTKGKTGKDGKEYCVRSKSAGPESSSSSSGSSVASAKPVKVIHKDRHGGVERVSYRDSRGRERTVVYDE